MNNSPLIIVTGGSGFIGSALIWELNNQGYDNILVVDQLGKDDKWRNLCPLKFRDFIEAEQFLYSIQQNTNFFPKVKYVFHLGACSSTTEIDIDFLMRNNFNYTKYLCNWTLQKNARFVYASSAATYGDNCNDIAENENSLNTLRPLNGYAFSKHLFDKFAHSNGILPYVVALKYFNVFGPNENHKQEMRSLVAKAYEQIKQTGKLKLFKSYKKEFEDGCQKRDFLYVKDAVKMTIHLAFSFSNKGIFNIGSGKAHTWLELGNAIFSAMGKNKKIEFIEMPDELRPKYQYFTQANIKKLRESDYNLKLTTLKNAVKDYIQNYLMKNLRLGDENLLKTQNKKKLPKKTKKTAGKIKNKKK